jgi:flagellar basal body-associated protein FliL
MRKPSFRLLCLVTGLVAGLGASARAQDDAGNKKAPEHKMTNAKSYLGVEPIYTTLVDDDRSVGMLMVSIGVDVPDADLRTVVDRSMPVLRDAYVRNLMNYAITQVRPNAQPDVGLIAERLQSVTDRALGKKGAKVLLAQVALRVTN